MAKLTAEQIAEMAASYGMEANVEDIKALEENIPTKDEVSEAKGDRLREADGVLRSLHYPHQLKTKICGWCERPFQTNYCSAGLCSASCRKRYLEKRFGLKWSPVGKPTWGEYEPPLLVSADAVESLEKWARSFIADLDDIRARSQEMTQNPESHPKSTTPGLDALLEKWGEEPISLEEDSEPLPQPPDPDPEPRYVAPTNPPERLELPDFDTEDFGSFEL